MLLGVWEEIVGYLKHAEVDKENGKVTLVLLSRGSLIKVNVPYNAIDYRALIGHKVGILRTDDSQRPYLIRVIEVSRSFASHKRRRL